MKIYEISEEIVKSLILYLQTKPYSEVVGGMVALSQLKEITNESKEGDSVPKKKEVASS